MSVDIRAMVKAGRAAAIAASAASEASKVGTLRGGSVGAVIDGEFYGKCPRLAHLRWQGHSMPTPADKIPMFDAGRANEDIVAAELGLALPADWAILREEAIPVASEVDGVPITGRPDLVLVDATGQPQQGLELKLVSSMWTAFAINFDLIPRSDHLIQAALYSHLLGANRALPPLPYSLYYSSRAEFHLSTAPKWLQDKFGEDVQDVEYKNGKPFKIKPFDRIYDLGWTEDGRFTYWTDGMDAPCITRLTFPAIMDYYLAVVKLGADGTAGPRPGTTAVDGSKSFNACDYCELAPVCDANEDDYEVWKDQAIVAIRAAESAAKES